MWSCLRILCFGTSRERLQATNFAGTHRSIGSPSQKQGESFNLLSTSIHLNHCSYTSVEHRQGFVRRGQQNQSRLLPSLCGGKWRRVVASNREFATINTISHGHQIYQLASTTTPSARVLTRRTISILKTSSCELQVSTRCLPRYRMP